MLVEPACTPVTTPTVLMVATPTLPDAHDPPITLLLSVTGVLVHMLPVPVIAATGLMVAVVIAIQPVGIMYDMVAEPPAIPLITPVDTSVVATPVLLLLHVPPAVASDTVVVSPIHARAVPVMADNGLQTTGNMDLQPVASA